MKIDFDHFRGADIADTIQANLQENRMLDIIEKLKPEFSKDGDLFCYLYGKDLQSGIAGFGDTVYEAMNDFCKTFWSCKANK